MNMIELHILQSFPVTCLNRDDLGAPKSALFGGVQRARVSSQSWKRAIRELAEGSHPCTTRSHFIAEKLALKLIELGIDKAQAESAAETVMHAIAQTDKKNKKDGHKSSVAMFFSDGEIEAIAQGIKGQVESGSKLEIKKGDLKKAIEKANVKDAADIAIFGRMVADDHTLTLEGAGLFSHALSTHGVANELDFFSAVDDVRKASDEVEDAGAGHIGSLEYNSACYYRYVGINLDLLRDADHLGHFSNDELKQVVTAFMRAAVLAVPQARKNSMFGFNPPTYVLGLQRSGQPISLINAFEKPVAATGEGYAQASELALKNHWTRIKKLYSLKADEAELPPENLDALIAKLVEKLS